MNFEQMEQTQAGGDGCGTALLFMLGATVAFVGGAVASGGLSAAAAGWAYFGYITSFGSTLASCA